MLVNMGEIRIECSQNLLLVLLGFWIIVVYSKHERYKALFRPFSSQEAVAYWRENSLHKARKCLRGSIHCAWRQLFLSEVCIWQEILQFAWSDGLVAIYLYHSNEIVLGTPELKKSIRAAKIAKYQFSLHNASFSCVEKIAYGILRIILGLHD